MLILFRYLSRADCADAASYGLPGRLRRVVILSVAVLAACLAPPLHAKPDWITEPYPYVVISQDADQIFTEFSRNFDVPVRLGKSVRGRIKGPLRGKSAGDFLDNVARAGQLDWYFDGFVLHVCAQSEFVTRLFNTNGANGRRIANQARVLGLADGRFPLVVSADGKILRVSGPPAYVSAIEQLSQQIELDAKASPEVRRSYTRKKTGEEQVRIFRGRSGIEERSLPAEAR